MSGNRDSHHLHININTNNQESQVNTDIVYELQGYIVKFQPFSSL